MRFFRPLFLSLGLVGVAALPLSAQDVITIPAFWAGPPPAPDVLPSAGRVRPSYPREARKSDEIGYVIVLATVDADGKSLTRNVSGSEVVFERAAQEELQDWSLKPGRMGNKPVYSTGEFMFIFNPKSASPDAPDATPRLLTATPLFIPHRDYQKLGTRPIIRVRAQLDPTGLVSSVELPTALQHLTPAVLSTLQAWKFAPARQAGQPVAATIQFNAVPQGKPNLGAAVQMPRAIKQAYPPYPVQMLYSRMKGEVTVHFLVDVKGIPRNITVDESSNPGFEDAAIEAVRNWRFQPGTRDGVPVAMTLGVPMVFQLGPISSSPGNDAYVLTGGGSELPEQYRYDVAPKLRGTIEPVYPYVQLRDRQTGEATVNFVVGPNGRVTASRAIKASQPEFGKALEAAVNTFRFDPALRKGKPVPTILSFHVNFDGGMPLPGSSTGKVFPEISLARDLAKHPEKLASAAHLDSPLRPISRRAGVFPPNLADSNPTGQATLRLVIDEDGRAHLPQIISASAPDFGYAAVQAAQYWRFDPPTIGGKPVMIQVEIPFHFRAE